MCGCLFELYVCVLPFLVPSLETSIERITIDRIGRFGGWLSGVCCAFCLCLSVLCLSVGRARLGLSLFVWIPTYLFVKSDCFTIKMEAEAVKEETQKEGAQNAPAEAAAVSHKSHIFSPIYKQKPIGYRQFLRIVFSIEICSYFVTSTHDFT